MRSAVVVQCMIFISYVASDGQVAAAAQDVNVVEHQRRALEELSRYNFLIGIANVGARLENATECGHELKLMLKAILSKELWSLKVIDSFGTASKSFIWGSYFWFSSQELCKDLNTPYHITFSNSDAFMFNATSPIPLRFTMVYLPFKSELYIDLKLPFESLIHAGLCLPKSCASEAILRYTDIYFASESFQMQRDFKLQILQAVDVRTPTFNWRLFTQTGSIIFGSICILVSALTIAAEVKQKSKRNQKIQQQAKLQTTTICPQQASERDRGNASMLGELLLCFCLSKNYKLMLQVDYSGNFLSAIAGIRTIICLWITVFHVYYYSLYSMTNSPLIFAKLENFALQPMIQACYYVDGFFVLSSFLLVYNFLSDEVLVKRIKLNNLWQNVGLFLKRILYRYIRLTPVLLVAILLSNLVFDLLNSYTPFHLGVHSGIYCKKTWWHNMLYIQNFLSMKDICCSWTWYLACEMQFFVLFTGLLFLHTKLTAKCTKIVYTMLTLGFVVTSWLCNYREGITFQIDAIHNTLDQLYIKPWVRINAYNGGAALGWCFFHHQEVILKFFNSHIVPKVAFWLLCITFYAATNFMSYWRWTPSWLVATIMSFGKLLVAVCVGGVTIFCACGLAIHLNRLLSARVFMFLNKFCFSIFMVSPVIIFATFGMRNQGSTFSEVGSIMDFISVVLISISASIFIFLGIELPIQRISNMLLKNSQQQRGHNGR